MSRMSLGTVLQFLIVLNLIAQDIDTSHFEGSRSHGSPVDRAESEPEHRAYLELQKTSDPAKRRALADGFLRRYPESWLLAGVYQFGADASLELKDYDRALADGRSSLRLLPENPPLLLVLAQIEVAQDKLPQAQRDAKDALLWLSLFAAPSGTKQSEWKKTREKLEEYLRLVIERAGGQPPKAQSAGKPHLKEKGEKFAGSQSCKPCHNAIYESWRTTGMAMMLRPTPAANILADFSRTNEFRDGAGSVKIRTGGGNRPYFEFPVSGGWKRFHVDYTIGSKWQQAYATRLPDERLFVFPIQYNALQKKWLNYWALIDPPGSERAQLDQFPRLSNATSYQRNCAVCHTSQLRLMRLDDDTMQKAAFREPGINCEMCHGPSALHVEAMQTGTPQLADPTGPPFRFSRLDHREATMICGECHRQSALRNLGSNGEMNYTAVSPYYLRLEDQPYAELGNRAFYRDGRFRETTFIGEAFMRSACFRRGAAQCASCHNPHPADPRTNRVSLKFVSNPDQMCIQCHSAIGVRVSAHTHHAVDSAGSRCAACHMPPIMNSLMFAAASHQIDDIPRAELTARFGQKESPNACLICHRGKDVLWVGGQLQAW